MPTRWWSAPAGLAGFRGLVPGRSTSTSPATHSVGDHGPLISRPARPGGQGGCDDGADLVGEQDGDPPCSGVGCCRSRVSRGEHEPADPLPCAADRKQDLLVGGRDPVLEKTGLTVAFDVEIHTWIAVNRRLERSPECPEHQIREWVTLDRRGVLH